MTTLLLVPFEIRIVSQSQVGKTPNGVKILVVNLKRAFAIDRAQFKDKIFPLSALNKC